MSRQKTQEQAIKDFRKIHNDKYDYSLVEYTKSNMKVKIICPDHGMFVQIPNSHLRGHGCPKCTGVAKSNTEEFVAKAKVVHNFKYDYSLTAYSNTTTKVKIVCYEHGEFLE